ncbi:hypothetical protein DDE82_001579 [Stemphylium lycopersici]|uniref:Uncharacterized protein n=1 Tax=Stemphylium lycopersici TaxID=183478 RepID=A0A364MZQ0_STELY|nr:hypothetical protein TW65_03467 [Stemphylium lycopersici]RAR07980.1 hypothetical protein DDE83_006225 [Stemphylium lycopersici]RAR09862.1 hypothetical protein DDE82_001579 [Stemphylium lycopersici]
MDIQNYYASQEAFPPPLPNHLNSDYSPALAMMQQFHADLLRMDEEHLQHRDQAAPEILSPFPDDDQPSNFTIIGRMRTWYRRLSRRSRTGDASNF